MTIDPFLFTCVGVGSDLPLLPHFVAHYRRLGVPPDRFRILLNSIDANDPALGKAREILKEEGISHVEDWIAPYTSDTMWEARRDLQSRHAGPDDWALSADVDEFHTYPEPLSDFLAACDAMGIDVVQGVFIDRLASGGRLGSIEPTPFVLDQFPVEAEVGWSIAGQGEHHGFAGTLKLMAVRGKILPSRGGHNPLKGQKVSYLYGQPLHNFPHLKRPMERFRLPTQVHHLHWTDTLPQRLERRLATPGVSPAGMEYGRKQLDHIARHDGIALDRVALRSDFASDDARRPWRKGVKRLRRISLGHKLVGFVRWILGR